jgi:hypothetical protein
MIVATSLRALAVGDLTVSLGHAEDIIRLERSLHIYYEPAVQHGFREFQLLGPVGLLYLLSHFGGSSREQPQRGSRHARPRRVSLDLHSRRELRQRERPRRHGRRVNLAA